MDLAKGASKILRGLNFFIYRMAESGRLLRLNNAPSQEGENTGICGYLKNALCFTTQKNMALEYRSHVGRSNLLLRVRGEDFLSALKKIPGMRLVLVSHPALATYQRIVEWQVGEREALDFFRKRTFRPQEVSLRNLRRACEIIALLPEGLNRIGFSRVRVDGVESLYSNNGKGDRVINEMGGFHRTVLKKSLKKDVLLRRLNRRRKKIQRHIFSVMLPLAQMTAKEFGKIKELKEEMEAIKEQIERRRAYLRLNEYNN